MLNDDDDYDNNWVSIVIVFFHRIIVTVMALYGLCFAPSNQTLFLQNHRPLSPSRPPLFFSTSRSHPSSSSSSSSSSYYYYYYPQKPKPDSLNKPITERPPFCLSKRMLSLSIVALLLSAPLSSFSKAMAEEFELERYTDSKEGFTLLKPSSWIKVDKAGATVLFEEANKGANSVGVVVSPVRLANLGEFGSPQFVADKLIQAEKRKESTKDAEVISVSERSGQRGLQVYEFEYKVDSTRGGMKRIFTAAFVASKKLYLLNIAQSDKPDSPLDTNRRKMLEQVLHSFDAALLI